MKHCCDRMQTMIDEEKSIVFIPEFREYGVPIRDGGSSFLEMEYCPWCGKKLPGSLREEYFDILEKSGISYPCPQDRLPEAMRSEKWWQGNEKYDPPASVPPAAEDRGAGYLP